MKVVTNSIPLIAPSKINRLELLREVHRSIYIPEEVYTEVVVNGVGKPGAAEVASADWIICQPVTDKDQVLILHNRTLIDLGECGAIVLAQEIGAERIIIDDRVARQVAIAKGLSVIGTVGVLRVAKARHIIPAIKPILDDLRFHGTRISDRLYYQTLTTERE
jgi:predicted nucleic acid-binding protein